MWVPVMRAKMLVLLQLIIRCVYSAIKIMQQQPKSLCLKNTWRLHGLTFQRGYIRVQEILIMSLDCSGNVSGVQLEWRQPSVAQIWIIESPATREEKRDFMNSKTSKQIISIRVYTLSFWTKLTESNVTSRRECRIMNCLSPEFFPLKHCGFHLYQVVTSIERSVVTLHLVITACLYCSPPEQSHRAEPLK